MESKPKTVATTEKKLTLKIRKLEKLETTYLRDKG